MRPVEQAEFLNERQTAALAGLAASTLRKWRQLRTGPPFVRLSRRAVRYSRADFLAWLESRRVTPANGAAREARV